MRKVILSERDHHLTLTADYDVKAYFRAKSRYQSVVVDRTIYTGRCTCRFEHEIDYAPTLEFAMLEVNKLHDVYLCKLRKTI